MTNFKNLIFARVATLNDGFPNAAAHFGELVIPATDNSGVLFSRLTIHVGPVNVPIDRAPIDSDGNADTLNGLLVGNFNFGFNGTTWDRLRAHGNNANAVTPLTLGVLDTNSYLYGFNATNWDRLTSSGTNANGVATVTLGYLNTRGFNYVFNGTTWDRWTGAVTISSGTVAGGTGDNADAVAVTTNTALRTTAENYGFNGTSWDRIRSGGNNANGVATSTLGNLNTLGFNYIFNGTTWDRWTGAITQIGTSATDRSGSIAVANTSQQAMASNTSRTEAWVANPSALTESIFINIYGNAAVVNGQGSIEIPPGTGWSGSTTNQINVIATTAGHVYTAGER